MILEVGVHDGKAGSWRQASKMEGRERAACSGVLEVEAVETS